jgi:hypothetical protein
MTRKILLALFIFLNVSILPASYADDEVIIDRITQQEAESLNIEIPTDTPPGFHEAIIQVTDENQNEISKVLAFCKTLSGEIKWDNSCSDVTPLFTSEELASISSRDELPTYSPAQEPEKTSDLQVSAFAALAVLSTGGAAAAGAVASRTGKTDNKRDEEQENDRDQGDLANIAAGKIKTLVDSEGHGDRSFTWRTPFRNQTDSMFSRWAEKVGAKSPVLARVLIDGNYLRAMFGALPVLLHFLGFALGILALVDVQFQALPPQLSILIAILICSYFDAASGALAACVFLIGTVVTGNITTLDEAMTVLGVCVLFFAPALLTSAVRPLHRLVIDFHSAWERATDYFLGSLLTGWATAKMVGALNGLAGVQLAITGQANIIGIVASAMVFVRLGLEDIASRLYPSRLKTLTTTLPSTSNVQQLGSLLVKGALFYLVALPFIGQNRYLILGTLCFLLPELAKLFVAPNLKKFDVLSRFLPQGALKIVVMVFVGTFFAQWVSTLFSNPQTFLAWSFVVLTIPGLILTLLGFFAGKSNQSWKSAKYGKWIYRGFGLVIFYAIFLMYNGENLVSLIFGN